MPSFNSIADLEKHLKNAIKDSLAHEVFETVRDVEQKNIDETVYDVYDPKVYPNIKAGIHRRETQGGLIADENIVPTMIGDDTLIVTNETPPNPYARDGATTNKNLAELIEYGDGYKGFTYDYPEEDTEKYKYMNPRPFTANTIEELVTTGKHKKALKDGLLRQGIKSE